MSAERHTGQLQYRILVAEDDADTRVGYREGLTDAGFDVVTARDGVEALEAIDAEPIDAVITDCRMPRMGGRELVARLRSRPETERMPILVVTGWDEASGCAAELRNGATDYLLKPVDIDELAARAHAQLRVQGSWRALAADPGASGVWAASSRAQVERIISRRAFSTVFQPIVRIDGDRMELVGNEALTRFHDGLAPPVHFTCARVAGLGDELELEAVAAAVEQAPKLDGGTWISLNVSSSVLADRREELAEILERVDRPVMLEITEREAVEDYAAVNEAIGALPGDVRIAVDDTGAGYAGLNHILDLRPGAIKLDLSLVRRIESDAARRALVRALVTFTGDIDSILIAEGVETPEQLRVLRELGVAFVQGYLIGRPAPISRFPGERARRPRRFAHQQEPAARAAEHRPG